MFEYRPFHYVDVVVEKKLFPNVFDECLISRNCLFCLREQRVLWMGLKDFPS